MESLLYNLGNLTNNIIIHTNEVSMYGRYCASHGELPTE